MKIYIDNKPINITFIKTENKIQIEGQNFDKENIEHLKAIRAEARTKNIDGGLGQYLRFMIKSGTLNKKKESKPKDIQGYLGMTLNTIKVFNHNTLTKDIQAVLEEIETKLPQQELRIQTKAEKIAKAKINAITETTTVNNEVINGGQTITNEQNKEEDKMTKLTIEGGDNIKYHSADFNVDHGADFNVENIDHLKALQDTLQNATDDVTRLIIEGDSKNKKEHKIIQQLLGDTYHANTQKNFKPILEKAITDKIKALEELETAEAKKAAAEQNITVDDSRSTTTAKTTTYKKVKNDLEFETSQQNDDTKTEVGNRVKANINQDTYDTDHSVKYFDLEDLQKMINGQNETRDDFDLRNSTTFKEPAVNKKNRAQDDFDLNNPSQLFKDLENDSKQYDATTEKTTIVNAVQYDLAFETLQEEINSHDANAEERAASEQTTEVGKKQSEINIKTDASEKKPEEMTPESFIRELDTILWFIQNATPKNGGSIDRNQLKKSINTSLERAMSKESAVGFDEGLFNQYIDTALNVLGLEKDDNLTLQTINDACAKVKVLRELPNVLLDDTDSNLQINPDKMMVYLKDISGGESLNDHINNLKVVLEKDLGKLQEYKSEARQLQKIGKIINKPTFNKDNIEHLETLKIAVDSLREQNKTRQPRDGYSNTEFNIIALVNSDVDLKNLLGFKVDKPENEDTFVFLNYLSKGIERKIEEVKQKINESTKGDEALAKQLQKEIAKEQIQLQAALAKEQIQSDAAIAKQIQAEIAEIAKITLKNGVLKYKDKEFDEKNIEHLKALKLTLNDKEQEKELDSVQNKILKGDNAVGDSEVIKKLLGGKDMNKTNLLEEIDKAIKAPPLKNLQHTKKIGFFRALYNLVFEGKGWSRYSQSEVPISDKQNKQNELKDSKTVASVPLNSQLNNIEVKQQELQINNASITELIAKNDKLIEDLEGINKQLIAESENINAYIDNNNAITEETKFLKQYQSMNDQPVQQKALKDSKIQELNDNIAKNIETIIELEETGKTLEWLSQQDEKSKERPAAQDGLNAAFIENSLLNYDKGDDRTINQSVFPEIQIEEVSLLDNNHQKINQNILSNMSREDVNTFHDVQNNIKNSLSDTNVSLEGNNRVGLLSDKNNNQEINQNGAEVRSANSSPEVPDLLVQIAALERADLEKKSTEKPVVGAQTGKLQQHSNSVGKGQKRQISF